MRSPGDPGAHPSERGVGASARPVACAHSSSGRIGTVTRRVPDDADPGVWSSASDIEIETLVSNVHPVRERDGALVADEDGLRTRRQRFPDGSPP